jgi:hypothetical protein
LIEEREPPVPVGTWSNPAPESDPGPVIDDPPILEEVESRVPAPPADGFDEIPPRPTPPAFLPFRVNGFIFPR